MLAATVACGLGMAAPVAASAATNPPPATGTHATAQKPVVKPAAKPKPTKAPAPKSSVAISNPAPKPGDKKPMMHKPLVHKLHKPLVHKPMVHKPMVHKPMTKPAPKKPVNGG